MNNEYKTTDIYVAAVLLYFNAKLVRIEKDPNNTKRAAFFVFDGNIDFDGIVADYHHQELTVEPKQLLYKFKEVKNRLYSAT